MAPKRKAHEADDHDRKRLKKEQPPDAKAQPAKKQDRAQSGLRDRVQEASKKVPRFLFRAWSNSSGGDSRLNTVDAITPRAFLHDKGPKYFYDISQSRILGFAREHYRGEHVSTPYSSWTQSLQVALDLSYLGDVPEHAHIGILDTARLDPANVVLHVGDFAGVCQARGQRTDNQEFLAFGVIKGECYKAVPCREFLACQTYSPYAGLQQPTMEGVIKIAQLFGKDMELAMAASLTTLPGTHYGDRQTLLAQLSTLHLPKEWHDDTKLARSSEVDYHRSREAEYAAKLIRRLIDIVEGKESYIDVEPLLLPSFFPRNPAPELPLLDVEEDPLEFVRDSEREEAQAALDAGTSIRDVDEVLARSRRKAFLEDKSVPRELKNLQTTMSGCHGVVEAHWRIHTKGKYPYDKQATQYLDAFKMQQLAETTPRFLFRAWSAESGGDRQLNTVDAITPRAFHKGTAPITLFAATKTELAYVLAFAYHHVQAGRTNIHISVMDTTKLGQDVLAIHSGYLCREALLLPDQRACQYEYLIFGVVRGHKSVPLVSMREAGYEKMFLPQWMEDAEHKEMIIDIIKRVSKLFGEDLELLVASHFVADMSRRLQMNESEMLVALSGFNLPDDWRDDSKMTTTARDTVHGFQGPPLAAKLIRNIIRMSKGLQIEAEERQDML